MALADAWFNNGLGNLRIRGVEGMDNDHIAASLHNDVLTIAAVVSLAFVGFDLRRRHRAAKATAAATVFMFWISDHNSHSASDTIRPILITVTPVWLIVGLTIQRLTRARRGG